MHRRAVVLVAAHPVAAAADVEDGGVADEAVHDGGGHDLVGEDLAQSAKPRLEVRMMEPFS